MASFKFTAGAVEERPEFFVPAGDYGIKVVEATADSSKGGNSMIKLKLRTLDKKTGDLGVSFFDYLVFTKATFFKVDQFLKSVGKHPGEGVEIDIDCDDLIGLEGEAALIVDEYNGKKSNKVAAYRFDEFD